MSHIVIDARIINSSTGRYVERLLHYLEQVDKTNDYTVLVPTKDLTYWRPTNPKFVIKAADFKNYSFGEQVRFKQFLDKLDADLVHFCMPQQPILYRGRTVTTFHDLTLLHTWNTDKNWFVYHAKQFVGKFVFRRVARKSSHIVVPSQYTLDDLVSFSGVSRDKITLTYEAAERFDGVESPYESPYTKFLVYVGQQSSYKNIRRLMQAHQRLLDRYPDLGLILVGKLGADAMSNKVWAESKGFKNIHFTGFVPDEQMVWLLKHCRAYVFPSLMEGFGLPPLEAMGQGAPVVASNATCIPEVCSDAAYYFDPLNVDDMAEAIYNVLSDHALRAKLIRRGHKQFAKYSWRRMAEQTHDVYMNVLKNSD